MAYIHQINKYDPQNDGGFGAPTISVFFNFCSFRCVGCWNQSTWDRKEELYRDNNDVIEEISSYIDYYLNKGFEFVGLSFLGGDPIVPQNAIDSSVIIEKLKQKYGNKIKICLWTGYVYERLVSRADNNQKKILNIIDRIVDGPFVIKKKTDPSLGLMYGSTNQRVIDLNEN